MKHQNRSVRIIGGKWRGRKVSFTDGRDIRPTGDRIRETLFNWLMHETAGARCLDLYAGSGALGIEALSRGASYVEFVEKDSQTSTQLSQFLNEQEALHFTVHNTSALSWLKQNTASFDIVFLDPPFQTDELKVACDAIANAGLATKYVYLETDDPLFFEHLPASWQIYRQKQAGSVSYCLCRTG